MQPLHRKTKFFLWNTNNFDRNGVNKQNTLTLSKKPEKDNTPALSFLQSKSETPLFAKILKTQIPPLK